LGQLSLFHRALWEFTSLATESQIQDIIELVKDHLVHILHTREGALITQTCLLHSSPKNRKHILKSFKGFYKKIAKEQYGHAVLLTLFDCVDDTVLVQKIVLSELWQEEMGETFVSLLRDRYGSRVFLYILSGREGRYQPRYLIEELMKMDEIRNKTSKKDDPLRQKELIEAISQPCLSVFQTHTNELLRDKQGGLVLLEGLKHLNGNYFYTF
jgi:pumilio family protein 6